MNQLPPSMDDVARAAGVSAATVSRVLNGTKAVSAKTRERVEASIEALGYRANPLGRSLSKGTSQMLLLLVPEFGNPYYAEIIRGAATAARKHGYTLLPVDLEASSSVGEGALDAIYSNLADGVINLVPIPEGSDLLEQARHKPWINCSEFLETHDIPYVSIDHRQAACDAVQYLINRGHTRIGLINSNERYRYARQRREGYEMALRGAGLAVQPELVRNAGAVSYELGSQAAASLLALREPPTAVFAVSDPLAIGAVKAFMRAGVRVPEGIAVVGFDDVPIAEVFQPALTTVAQPMQELGMAAVEMLVERLAGNPVASRVLPYSLKLRDTA